MEGREKRSGGWIEVVARGAVVGAVQASAARVAVATLGEDIKAAGEAALDVDEAPADVVEAPLGAVHAALQVGDAVLDPAAAAAADDVAAQVAVIPAATAAPGSTRWRAWRPRWPRGPAARGLVAPLAGRPAVGAARGDPLVGLLAAEEGLAQQGRRVHVVHEEVAAAVLPHLVVPAPLLARGALLAVARI